MRGSAHYNKLNYVEYFRLKSGLKIDDVDAFLANSICRVAVEAFYLDFIDLKGALNFIFREDQGFPSEETVDSIALQSIRYYAEILKQATRQRSFNEIGINSISLEKIKTINNSNIIFDNKKYKEFWSVYEGKSILKNNFENSGDKFSHIYENDKDIYLSYFSVAFKELVDKLLSDEEILQDVGKFFESGHESADDYIDLVGRVVGLSEKYFIPLESNMKVRFLTNIINDIRRGIIHIPSDMKKT